MPKRTGRDLHAGSEDGFSLVELVVAAAILITAVVGIFTALEAVGRAGADERARAVAYQLAQEDQSRMRAMKATALIGTSRNGMTQTRTVNVDGSTYTVKSTSKITADATGTETCEVGSASADYLSINSTVTWPTMDVKPVSIQSIIAPRSGSFDPDTGALAISVVDRNGVGLPNVPLTGTGPSAFSGMTNENGCIIFANLPEGSYTVTPTAAGLVNSDGDAAGPEPAGVLAGATNTKVFQLDRPGSVEIRFQTRKPGFTTPQPSQADTVQVFNALMTSGGKTFGTLNTRVSSIRADSLFPFSDPNSIYAGSCSGNTPPSTTPLSAIATALIPPGSAADPVTITLPALDVTVRTGSSSTNQGTLVNGAKVILTDKNCSNVKRTLFTNATGKLPDPGVPWSTYDICVSGRTGSNSFRLIRFTNVDVKNPNTPTVLNAYLSGTGSSSTNSTGCT